MSKPTLEQCQQVRDEADCLYDEAAVKAALTQLSSQVASDYAGLNPVIICVMNGAFWLTAHLVEQLDMPLEIDYLHASRYRNRTTGGELVWKAEPQSPLADRHVLIIDDILDEGITLSQIQRAISGQQVASLKTLVLLEKQHDRCIEGANADYVGLKVEDRYVFGCGMDYYGQWRQLPAIYAVKGL